MNYSDFSLGVCVFVCVRFSGGGGHQHQRHRLTGGKSDQQLHSLGQH